MTFALSKDLARDILIKFLQGRYPHARTDIPYNIKVYTEDRANIRMPLEVDENKKTVRLVSDDFLSMVIKQAVDLLARDNYIENSFLPGHPAKFFNFNATQISDAKKMWLYSKHSEINHEVKSFCMLSDPSYSFARAEFDLMPEKHPCPTFDQLMRNFSNAFALRCFVGSLLIDDSDRQQYVWMHGDGGDGKGSFIRAIAPLFGKAFFSSTTTPRIDNNFWTFNLIGKRLVVFPECDEKGFPASGYFKSLCGDDTVLIEPKGKQAYNKEVRCKYVFLSNDLPKITTSTADQRRIILCKAQNQEGFEWQPSFEDNLRKELPAFISNCVLDYEQACPNHGPIPAQRDEAYELGMQTEEIYELFLEQHFELDPSGRVTAAHMSEIIEKNASKYFSKQKFHKYLDKNGVKRGLVLIIDGKPRKAHEGIRPKH